MKPASLEVFVFLRSMICLAWVGAVWRVGRVDSMKFTRSSVKAMRCSVKEAAGIGCT
jgi:hypothetical protein